MGIILGTIMFIGFTFQTVGLKYTDASKQGFIISIYTVIVPFLSWLVTKSKPQANHLLAAIVTILGVAILSLNASFKLSYGDGLTLVFAILFALQIVLTGIFAKNANVLHLTSIQMTTTGILAIIMANIMRHPLPSNYVIELPSILYMVFICTLSAFFFQNYAQSHTRDSHASIIISLEAVFGFILGIWILNESLTFKSITGCLLIFCGVLVSKADHIQFI